MHASTFGHSILLIVRSNKINTFSINLHYKFSQVIDYVFAAGVRLYSGAIVLTIPNYAMISELVFREQDYGIGYAAKGDVGENDGLNDGLWCQSATSDNTTGTWIQPNEANVPGAVGIDVTYPLYMVHSPGQVGLLRPHLITGVPSLQGLYQCPIVDDSGHLQTMVVWIGGDPEFNNVDGRFIRVHN